ncbi:MAG: recombinase family protein [Mycobacterium sp.]
MARAGVAERDIHIDTASGAKASRPELDLVLQLLREGDTLVITRLDRLSRSVLHLITLGAELRGRGIGLKVTEQGIDTTTVEGRAMFGMLSVLAELQRELIVANTRDGLAAARARGRAGGRRPKLTPDQAVLAQQLYDGGEKTVAQIAAIFKVPRSTGFLRTCRRDSSGSARTAASTRRPAAAAFSTGAAPSSSRNGRTVRYLSAS